MHKYNLIFADANKRKMNIAFFNSVGPGNLKTTLETQEKYRELMEVRLVVSDCINSPGAILAKRYGIPVLELDFISQCGRRQDVAGDINKESKYLECSRIFHDKIFDKLIEFESKNGEPLDLLVLAYRRIISGKILEYYKDRIINQHPADLSVLQNNPKERKYIGIRGLERSIRDNNIFTRTSTILVNDRVDGGEILAQGPKVNYEFEVICSEKIKMHEDIQKVKSDKPALSFCLKNIANGNYAISEGKDKLTGLRTIYYAGQRLGYCGYQLGTE